MSWILLDGRAQRARGSAALLCTTALTLLGALACSSLDAPAPGDTETISSANEALSTTSVTEAGDDQRTGFYGNQPRLSPSVVSGSTFGRLFSATVSGQVYAQPLFSQGTLLVVTETNDIYGLDPETGAQRWHRNVGTPFDPTTLPCGDLTPSIGVTGTPVIDSATNTAYFFAKVTDSSGTQTYAHALDVATGIEKANFPVKIAGTAANAPGMTFDPVHELQRPGLLLLGGKLYAAFGAHCDVPPWQGWIVGVSTDGTSQTRWVANKTGSGAGIWQSGGGIMSDGPGRLFVATGNGGAPKGPILGSQASSMTGLGEAIVRVDVQSDGSLRAGDFFAPYDAQALDDNDVDFASGAPVALPDTFGTATYPHLLVAVGKQGYVYLLNRDNLGGIATGPGGGDASVFRSSLNGGVWSKPAVWPGDGGYVYIPTASGGGTASSGSSGFLYAYRSGVGVDGKPTLNVAGKTADAFGFTSSRPIVTSDGSISGTAIVWVVWAAGGNGKDAQLRAYRAIPNASGTFDLLFQAPVGQSAKFNPPGVGDGRIYVGTRDGHVLGFGSPVTPVLSVSPAQFNNTVVGSTTTVNVQISAAQALTIQNVLSSSPEFVVGSVVTPTLAAGASTTVPVSFKPSSSGLKSASLVVSTTAGSASTSLSGMALSPTGELTLSAAAVSFGGATVGSTLTQELVLTNTGATPLTLQGFTAPTAPFSVQLPAAGTQIAPSARLTLNLQFSPTALGNYTGSFGIRTAAGTTTVPLSGSCTPPGHLSFTPLTVDFGRVALTGTRFASFEVKNTGGIPITITKSKPPVPGTFTAVTELGEGSQLGADEAVVEWVAYTPPALGTHDDVWVFNATGDNGVQQVAFHGTTVTGVTSAATAGWQFNGSATGSANQFVLTAAGAGYEAGSAFWTTALPSANLDVSFDAILGGGQGADGMAFVLADAATQSPSALGTDGGGLGFKGISGIALALDTYKNGADPSNNFVGLSNGPLAGSDDGLNWLATATTIPQLRDDSPVTHHVHLYVVAPNLVVVELDGKEVIRQVITLPNSVYVGFSGGNGGLTDLHAVANVSIVSQAQGGSTSASVLGFENPSQWQVSAGTVSSSSIVTQGSASLGIAGTYYAELTSIPLSNVGTAGSSLSFDFRPPAALTYGSVQLWLDAPSVGVYMRNLGQVSVAGFAANAYRTLRFAVPSDVVTALGRSYTDLRIKLSLNANSNASPYLFDALRFGN